MNQNDGILVRKRKISDLNQGIGVNFKDLFKAVGKGIADGVAGNWDRFAKDGVDALGALTGSQRIEITVWLLIYRAINRAVRNVVKDNQSRFNSDYKNYDSIAGQVKYALEEVEITINQSFFQHPQELLKVIDIQTPLSQWLQHYGITQAEAQAMTQRFPRYFLYALRHEWHTKSTEYQEIVAYFNTPFAPLIAKEESWLHYYAWLQKQVDQPIFDEAFGLRQVYIKPKAYYKVAIDSNQDLDDELVNRKPKFQKIVVDLFDYIHFWLKKADRDALRIISGDPGAGKSSFSKMLADELCQTEAVSGELRVLFIPLHRLNVRDDLVKAVDTFIRNDEYLSTNPLDPERKEKRLLIIFDGLDELSMQGKLGTETAKSFINEVQRTLQDFNYQTVRLQVIISGRPIVISANQDELRKPKQILHILPYFVAEHRRNEYQDDNNLLLEDQRNSWWQKYGALTGNKYTQMPRELDLSNLLDITTQPLLNYLVALSYVRSQKASSTGEKIIFSEETNLNAIYQDLLQRVYERGWDTAQHPHLKGVSEKNFGRILEEIALAAWHGNGRTTTVQEIEAYCVGSGLRKPLEIFTKGAKSGVTNLLTTFYFRQSGYSNSNERTFEFTHKSFGEYLTAKRIVRELRRINKQLQARKNDPDEGWDEKEALKHWITICGMTAIDQYLYKFMVNEVSLQPKTEVKAWQTTLRGLIGYMLRQGMPMETIDSRPSYREECRQSRNAEEALLVILSACAKYTQEISNIPLQSEYSFRRWLARLRNSTVEQEIIVTRCLNGLDLIGADLDRAILIGADLSRADLRGANLSRADLSEADLSRAMMDDQVRHQLKEYL